MDSSLNIVIYRCLSFCTFSFCHCVVCSSSVYGFWLPLLVSSNFSYILHNQQLTHLNSLSSPIRSECTLTLYLGAMYIHCVYSAMTKQNKTKLKRWIKKVQEIRDHFVIAQLFCFLLKKSTMYKKCILHISFQFCRNYSFCMQPRWTFNLCKTSTPTRFF